MGFDTFPYPGYNNNNSLEKQTKPELIIPISVGFTISFLSSDFINKGTATCFVHPDDLDMIKDNYRKQNNK